MARAYVEHLPAIGLWFFLPMFVYFYTGIAHASDCGIGSGATAIQTCEKELARAPNSINVKLQYANVLMRQKKYQQAAGILGEALRMQPGNNVVKQKFRLATSLAEEQKAINQSSIDTPAAGTSSSVNEILCRTLKGIRAINACNKLLTTNPRNITALTRRGDELLALNKTRDAVASYRLALAVNSANPALKDKLKKAESRLPKKKRHVVTRQDPQPATDIIATTSSRPKIQPPTVKPTPTIESEPLIDTAEVVQHFSNGPLPSGSTF